MKLVQHVGLTHAHEAGFSITCGLNDCQSTFSNYPSFRCHVYRKHRACILPTDDPASEEPSSENPASEDGHERVMCDDADVQTPPCMDTLLYNFKNNLCGFILKCREKNNLPESVQQEIHSDVNFLFCFFKQNYDEFISYHLKENGFDVKGCLELKQVLQSNDFFEEASKEFSSQFKLKEYCKSRLDLTEPVQYTLRGSTGHKIGSFSYVPISDVLKKYCSH